MSVLTAAVLAALAAYVGGMMFGSITANFELLLFICTVVSGVYFAAEKLHFLPSRQRAFAAAVARGEDRAQAQAKTLSAPWWIEYTASFFPVIVLVFALRSFAFEPFRIPSDSMVPTLEDGDLILVKKYVYGVRLPLVYSKLVDVGQPQRGDVIVFRYPLNPTQDYIKRVVGLPGDKVEYGPAHRLLINGIEITSHPIERYYYARRAEYLSQAMERLGDVEHRIAVNDGQPMALRQDFAHTDPSACRYSADASSLQCTVPPGHYFAMGDNRDNSQDSRIWGFVPAENIKGRAFLIWMNFGSLSRIGIFK